VSPLLRGVGRLLLGPALIVAAAIIVKGYTDVGDGFSAGVVVALALAIQYITLGTADAEGALPVLRHAPRIAAAGLLLGLAVGFAPLLFGDAPFTHWPPRDASPITFGTLELISAVLFDVGVFLLVVGVVVELLHHLAAEEEAPVR